MKHISGVDTTIEANKKLLAKFNGPYTVHRVLPDMSSDIENYHITDTAYDVLINFGPEMVSGVDMFIHF